MIFVKCGVLTRWLNRSGHYHPPSERTVIQTLLSKITFCTTLRIKSDITHTHTHVCKYILYPHMRLDVKCGEIINK